VGDLLLAEAVHHQVSARPNLAQTALSGLDTDVALPSDFEVVRTDSDSSTRAWHVILPLTPDQVDAWAAGLIGDSSNWSITMDAWNDTHREIRLHYAPPPSAWPVVFM